MPVSMCNVPFPHVEVGKLRSRSWASKLFDEEVLWVDRLLHASPPPRPAHTFSVQSHLVVISEWDSF